MEITKQQVERYLDGLVVEIYISQGRPERIEKFREAIEVLQWQGYNVRQYVLMLEELRDEYL